jgi:hypothetical protein
MVMITDLISRPLYQILTDLTQEQRLDVALALAVKELIRLKLKEATEFRQNFEQRYNMTFETFQSAWDRGQVNDQYSYETERDYWEWEASVTDENRLRVMLQQLP